MPIIVCPDGPIPARVMIVGEAPGADEERTGTPFVGVSGQELNKMLHEAGIMRSECFVTNLVDQRPLANEFSTWVAMKKKDIGPQHVSFRDKYVLPLVVEGYQRLIREIEAVKPNIIIPVGGWSTWALTGKYGITKWRGSMLYVELPSGHKIKCIPTIHPASVLREWSQRAAVVNDLRRAARFRNGEDFPDPHWNFIIRPSFVQVISVLERLYLRASHEPVPLRLSFDLETRGGHIACAGISWTLSDAICIPLMCVEKQEGYWDAVEEAEIVYRIYRLLTHKNVEVVGQNILYDSQYTYRHWHFIPNVKQDTMISQHSIFSDLPKNLAFQASMYCNYYVFWKEDK